MAGVTFTFSVTFFSSSVGVTVAFTSAMDSTLSHWAIYSSR